MKSGLFTRSSILTAFLAGLLSLASGYADTPDPQIENLLGRFSPAEVKGGGHVLLSYENSNRSFLYDQALAVLAFVHADQKTAAEDVLNALAHLQSRKGSWVFQYESVSNHVIPAEEKVSPSGAIAWVAMAIEAYYVKYGPKEFVRYRPMLERTLKYLAAQRVIVDWKGLISHPIAFSPTRTGVVSFEHNLDAYAAFSNAPPGLKNSRESTEAAASIQTFLESMWNTNRFYAGFNVEQREPNQDENYLDTQSWGVLALGVSGRQGQDFRRGLATNCSEFKASKPTLGFTSYKPARVTRAPASAKNPVWTEGSLGMMLAMKLSDVQNCNGTKLSNFESALDTLTQKDGGVPYAVQSSNPDFSSSSSIAGTAWKYFFQKDFNPFHPTFN
jgi:hypothetical protein